MTGRVLIVNVAVVDPPGTTVLEGTVATLVFPLESVTTAPAAGAGPLSVTVPVDGLPPRTELGLNVTELSVAAVTPKFALRVALPYVPEMVTVVLDATGTVLTAKVAVVLLAGIVTDAGTAATELLLLESNIVAPLAGAGPLSVTVPVDGLPPGSEVGRNDTELRVAAVTVNAAVRVVLPYTAETVAVVLASTGTVVTVNVAVMLLAGTVTVAGTVAADGLLLDRRITAPPAPAGPLRVTVPVDGVPPRTEVGLTETTVSAAAETFRLAF